MHPESKKMNNRFGTCDDYIREIVDMEAYDDARMCDGGRKYLVYGHPVFGLRPAGFSDDCKHELGEVYSTLRAINKKSFSSCRGGCVIYIEGKSIDFTMYDSDDEALDNFNEVEYDASDWRSL